jgi:signal transduction histidine kinase
VPALYAWLRGHPRLVDGALALLLILTGTGLPKIEAQGLLRILLILSMVVPLVFRRKHPVGAFAAVVVTGAVQVLALDRPTSADLAVLIVCYTLAAYTPRRISLCGLAICLLGAAVAVVRWQPAHAPDRLTAMAWSVLLLGSLVLAAWLLGDSIRWRRGFYQALEERASRLERERDAQAQVAAAAERARIARDLHDVVAHNVSVMVVQADGAAYALDSSPQRAREALGAISATGRRALAELRSLLGVLRDSADPGAALAPQPGLEQLEELVVEARAAGLPVSLRVEGVPRPVPQGEALAAYRVVQESLTNARKHAGPGATAAVRLRYAEESLVISVTDDGRGASAPGSGELAGPGHGLAGMRERVELYGGSVRSGPRAGGGYEVVAHLPLALEAA